MPDALKAPPARAARPALSVVTPAPDGAPPAAAPLVQGRDLRLDVFRGLALVMIFINHVPGTVFERFTSRNFGFTDAAEGFVFMSGISAALAYGAAFASRPWWPAIARCWSRAWTLYLVHILVMAWALAIAAGMARYAGLPDMLAKNNLQYLWRDPMGALTGIPLLSHQYGYVNILPVYTVLILAAPLMLFAALRWPRRLVVASVALWAVAGFTYLNLPNMPTNGGWFFNPFAWQLLFVLGILTGWNMKQGRRFVPRSRWLFWPAVAYLVMALVWVKYPPFGQMGNAFFGKLASLGLPTFIRDFDKTYVAIPRLLHILALVYVISCLDIFRRFSESRWAAPLALLGRQALPVFALGTVLAFAGQAIKLATPDSLPLDAAILSAGLALQLLLAGAKDWSRRSIAAARAAARRSPGPAGD